MDQEKKRGREESEERKELSEMKTAKRQELTVSTNTKESNHENNSNSFEFSDNNYMASGVFDFPWLKEGMISTSEDLYFEDTFSLSLPDTYTTTMSEFSGQCLCESQATYLASISYPIDRFESLEFEGVDCTWSSLLNQPVQQGSS